MENLINHSNPLFRAASRPRTVLAGSIVLPVLMIFAVTGLSAAAPNAGPDKDKPEVAVGKPRISTNQRKNPGRVQPSAKQSKRRRRAPTLEMNPNSKWACDETTFVAKPMWRGAGRVKFPFKIRNEGTAALQIRAKGG